jgi:putative membrane protein
MMVAALAHAGWGPGAWWPIFPLFWIALWGVLIFVFLRSRRRWGGWHASHSGEGVLAERYARGEINEEEYRARLTVLRQHHS